MTQDESRLNAKYWLGQHNKLAVLVSEYAQRAVAAEAKLSKAVEALERIRNENQVRYIQIGDDPNENGPTIQTDGPFAKIASATLKKIGGDNE